MNYKLSDYHKALLDKYIERVQFQRFGKKTTVCFMTAYNGFEIVGTSSCVDPFMFNQQLGEQYALEEGLEQLGEHIAFIQHNIIK